VALLAALVVFIIRTVRKGSKLKRNNNQNIIDWQTAFVKVYGRMPTDTDLADAKREGLIEESSVTHTLLQYPQNWFKLRYAFLAGLVIGFATNFGNITSMFLGSARVSLVTGPSEHLQYLSVGALVFSIIIGIPFFLFVGLKSKMKKHPKFDGVMAIVAIFALGLAVYIPFIQAEGRQIAENRTDKLSQIEKKFGTKGDFDVYDADTNELMYDYPFAKTKDFSNDGDDLNFRITSTSPILSSSSAIKTDDDVDAFTAGLQDTGDNDVTVDVTLDDAGRPTYDISQNLPIDSAKFSDMRWSNHKLYGTMKINDETYNIYIKY
jgi:hypothetical protein